MHTHTIKTKTENKQTKAALVQSHYLDNFSEKKDVVVVVQLGKSRTSTRLATLWFCCREVYAPVTYSSNIK